MNYNQLELREKDAFDLKYWKGQIEFAKAQRSSCGWDEQAENGWRIYENDLPLSGKHLTSAPDWKGQFYVDNWIKICLSYKVSMQMGSAISIDLKTDDGSYSPAQELLEREVNYAYGQFEFLDAEELVLLSKYYTGMGWKRNIWNTRRRTVQYLKGIPVPEHVDSLKVWLDPATCKQDKTDRRWIYHEEYLDLATIRNQYPKWATRIQESNDPKRPEAKGQIKIGTLQYKRVDVVERVFIEDHYSGASASLLKSEYDALIEELGQLPEKVELVTTDDNPTGVYENEEDCVFNVIFAPDFEVILAEPQHIGDTDDYQCNPGHYRTKHPYSFGDAFYMSDLQEMDIISMTVQMIQVLKWYRMKEKIVDGSLENEEIYKRDGHKLGVNPIEKAEWGKAHPGVKSVEPIPLPDYPIANDQIHERIKDSQQQFSGVTEITRGEMPYAGMPGMAIAQLTASARVAHRTDISTFRKLVKQDAEWLMRKSVIYRNYPHVILGSDTETGAEIPVEVGTNAGNMLADEGVYIEVTIQENHELAKELEKQYAETLRANGMLSRLTYLQRTGDVNPEKTLKDADAENPILVQAQQVASAPDEAKQRIADFINQTLNPQPQQEQQPEQAANQ